MMEEPQLSDFYSFDTKSFNLVEYFNATEEYEERKRQRPQAERRPFYERKTRPRSDKRQTSWFVDYVIDAEGRYDDPSTRDGGLFRKRFCLSKAHMFQVVTKLRADGIWTERCDAFGRDANPVELLLLGTLRILTRNWTFDDVYEATKISERCHRAFFKVFVT